MQIEDMDLHLLDSLDTGIYESSVSDIDRMHKLVLSKAGAPEVRRGFFRSTRLLLVAAVVLVSGLAVAAGFLKSSDAFRGALREQNADGELVPISETAPVVDRSGLLLNQSYVAGDIEVSLRGVVGDEKGFKVLLDVSSISGKELALTQPDGALSNGELSFWKADIAFEDEKLYAQGSMTRGVALNGSKGEVMLEVEADQQAVRGQAVRITLRDLMQQAERSGSDTGVGSLYDLVSRFEPPTGDMFEESGHAMDENGNVTEIHYRLAKDGDEAVQLGGALSRYYLTNAVLWQGNLYLKGYASAAVDIQRDFNAHALRNMKTGEVVEQSSMSAAGGGKHDLPEGLLPPELAGQALYSWDIEFFRVTEDMLPDLTIIRDYGWSRYPVQEGEWSFDITLDYQNTTVTAVPVQPILLGDQKLAVAKMMVSPFMIEIIAHTDAAGIDAAQEFGDTLHTDHIQIHLKNGTTVHERDCSSSMTYPAEDQPLQLTYELNVVIDPQLVQSIEINGMVFEVGK